MKILKATIVIRSGHPDNVGLTTDLPAPSQYNGDMPLFLSFNCPRKTGAEYVRKHFDLEPEIIAVS